MRFSVIINSYNGEPWIAEAIDSVLAQTCDDWELIVVDDSSSDATVEIANGYSDPRIRVIVGDRRLGISEARNRAIAEAKGDWIAFLDQDDLWLPHKLASQADLIDCDSNGELGIVYGRTRRFEGSAWRGAFDAWHGEQQLPEGDIHKELLRKPSFVALSSGCILRSALEKVGSIPAEVRYCPDYYLFLAVSEIAMAACVQSVICLYRVHPQSMSSVFDNEIHREVLQIARSFAPDQSHLLSHRSGVLDVLLARSALRSGRVVRAARHLLHGRTLIYFAAYPFVQAHRLWRRRDRGQFKYRAIESIRSKGLLVPLDYLRYQQRRVQNHWRNRRFERRNPGFAVPPPAIAFDAFNKVDWDMYRDGGRKHAEVFTNAILDSTAERKVSVLEWGCGPGRILRHLPELLGERCGRLAGSDYNGDTIAWCRTHLPAIAFAENGLMPPLPFADASFDAVYSFSVFTHLSESVQMAWASELMRVLKPGGVLLSTTHGVNYLYLLTRADEMRTFARGSMVAQDGYTEGRKWYFAVHPPAFVRNRLFRDFADVRQIPVPAEAGMLQDLWLARKAETAVEPAAACA
jgi:glycosyltransferase involved in cell wall biosynthesis/SAM-dependent methyltransferase